MENNEIEVISEHIEIHPSHGDWAVVRDGSVYGTYADQDYARQLAEELEEEYPTGTGK